MSDQMLKTLSMELFLIDFEHATKAQKDCCKAISYLWGVSPAVARMLEDAIKDLLR